MLEFPRWKYVLILLVLVLAALYALPNAYQKNPAVQITPSTSEARIDEALKARVDGLLQEAGLTPLGNGGRELPHQGHDRDVPDTFVDAR